MLKIGLQKPQMLFSLIRRDVVFLDYEDFFSYSVFSGLANHILNIFFCHFHGTTWIGRENQATWRTHFFLIVWTRPQPITIQFMCLAFYQHPNDMHTR